jgi:energy-coupling factor transporter ATP-binding protein EcfA2
MTSGRKSGFAADFASPAAFSASPTSSSSDSARAHARAKLLIFDEPTSALTVREVESLFQHMQRLKERGIAILFISHRLNEVLEISDQVSVLRDGSFVLREPTEKLTPGRLVEAMLPGATGEAVPQGAARPKTAVSRTGTPVLEGETSTRRHVHDVSLGVWPGEVVGLTGKTVRAGRTELRAILGLDGNVHGEVHISGRRSMLARHGPAGSAVSACTGRPSLRMASSSDSPTPRRPAPRCCASSAASSCCRAASGFFPTKLRPATRHPRPAVRSSPERSRRNQQRSCCQDVGESKDHHSRRADARIARARQDVYRIIRDLTGAALRSCQSSESARSSTSVTRFVMYRGRVEELAAGTSASTRSPQSWPPPEGAA